MFLFVKLQTQIYTIECFCVQNNYVYHVYITVFNVKRRMLYNACCMLHAL